MKKIIPIMIALSMLTICFVALDIDSDAVLESSLYVNGEEVNTAGNDSGTGWTYTQSTNTLTITDATYSTTPHDGGERTAILYDGRTTGLKLVINGTNTISSTTTDVHAVFVNGDLEISGTGTLNATSGPSTYGGIFAMGDVGISGCTINASGAVMDFCAGGSTEMTSGTVNLTGSGCFDSTYDFIISGTALVEAKVTCSSSGSLSIGGDMTMAGGTVIVKSTTDFDAFVNGSFIMTGGTLNLTGTGSFDGNGTFNMSGGTINSNSGLIVENGSSAGTGVITMTGGTINTTSVAVDDFVVRAFGGDEILNFTGAVLSSNLTPKKYVATEWVACDIAEATAIVANAAGNTSISFGAPSYTVSFDKNGGTGTMADVTGVSGSYTLPACTFTAPSGKQFKCWSVADVEKNVGDSITVTANTTVKAIWQAAGTGYTVTFDANGGTGTMAQVTGVSGEYTLPESTFTAPDGKEFKCWKVGDDEKNAGDKITVSSDVTVKAVWKDKSSGGGSNLGLIIGGVVAGVIIVGAVAFFLIKRH